MLGMQSGNCIDKRSKSYKNANDQNQRFLVVMMAEAIPLHNQPPSFDAPPVLLAAFVRCVERNTRLSLKLHSEWFFLTFGASSRPSVLFGTLIGWVYLRN